MTLLDQISGAHSRVLNPSGGCHNCPRKRVDFVPATLCPGSVLWLGEAPGATEVLEQEGFVGTSGQLLRREATVAGVPAPWSFSYAIHCRPPNNATPVPKEVRCCLSQFVLDEIRGYRFVVLVGTVPLQALFPGAKGSHFRGNFAHHPDFPGQLFYAIYHPAHIARRPDLLAQFQKQLERLGRVARNEPHDDVEVVRGPDGVEALAEALAAPIASLDLETNGEAVWEPTFRIESLAVTADGRRVAVVHESDPWFPSALEMIRRFLEDPSKCVVGSYVAFDVDCMEHELDFEARANIVDVTLVWYEAGGYKQPSLKQLVAEQLDGYRWLVHDPAACRDADLLLRYNGEDAAFSIQLFAKGMAKLGRKTRDLVVRALCPMSLVYRRAHTRGLYLRQDYRQQKIAEYAERRRAAVSAWKEEDPAFVPSEYESGKGLAHYLFYVRSLPVLAETVGGQPQVDRAVIKQWIRDHGAGYLRHLLAIREIDKIVGTYLTAYDKHVGWDSRLHPSYWLTSTDTSRPSSSNPNVYNIPQEREIRDMFGVPPGSVMLESDFSQIEFRIMVCLAKDENGIAGYLRGDDAHTLTARTITGNPTPTKEQRTNAKPINFGFLYGAAPPTVQRQVADEYGILWTDVESDEFKAAFMRTYPRIPELQRERRERLITNRGWFESVTGHTFHYAEWDHPDRGRRDHAVRAAINAEAQGPAANICYFVAAAARRLLAERGFRGVEIVNSVYDSIMFEIPDPRQTAAVVEALEEASQLAHAWVADWFVVPLVMEHSVGESWGSLEKWSG